VLKGNSGEQTEVENVLKETYNNKGKNVIE
jgi:hypothetical protein